MVEWLAGNRIIGTTAERPVASLQSPSVGGWVELARTTLGNDISTIDVSSIPDKRYYMILMDYTQTSDFAGLHRLGNSSIDPNNNYHNTQSSNGGTDASSQATYVRLDNGWQSGDRKFVVEYIADLTNKEKLIMNHMARLVTTGAGQVPQRSEVVSKWVPSTASDTVGKFQMMNGGNYASGSEVVVLGWDPTDTHTTNFWEELASVDLTGGAAATLSSGTFTAKKYLWVQYYTSSIASSTRPDLIFNSDTTSSYANRYNYNGTESEAPSENSHFAGVSANTNPFFANFFIINNHANEKLSIGHGMSRGGSGAGTAPVQRFELAQKWTNTSSQIANITLTNDASANFGTNTYLKVWGSD